MPFVTIFEPLDAEQASPAYLGGKGYGLWLMRQHGINVPPALVFPTTLCVDYMKKPKTVMAQVKKDLPALKKFFTDQFGYLPLVSVRSGARVSMPGMMDTILNVGLDPANMDEWTQRLGARCVKDSRERLVVMYGNVVKGLVRERLEDGGARYYAEAAGDAFPDADGQLLGAIEAVFNSWNNERAKFYRKMHVIPEQWGTAVVVQAMVFGNLNDNSGTGVLFTRNPDTGEDVIVGEFLTNAQGEDVVAGTRTPMPLAKLQEWNPAIAVELAEVATRLETLKADVQDIEFTVQDGKLYILQTRNAKRSAVAAVRTGLDMLESGMINFLTFQQRVSIGDFDRSQQKQIAPHFKDDPKFIGIPASSGVVTGIVVKTAQAAIDCDEPCVLVTQETTPDDVAGMHAAVGVLTMQGGATCHAAVIARGMNKACVVGLGKPLDLFAAGATLSLDGATGRVWFGTVPVIDGSHSPLVDRYWATLRQHLGYVPVIDCVDHVQGGQALYHVSADARQTDQAVADICALVPKLDRLYVDLRVERIDPAETEFFRLFAVPTSGKASSNANALLTRLHTALSATDEAKLVLLGHPALFGMGSLVEVRDLRSLVLAGDEGLLVDGFDWTDDLAVHRVLEWRKADPVRFVRYGTLVPAIKSFLSDAQALLL